MTICISDHLITVETIAWLVICSLPVTVFKLPTVLKESLHRSKIFHRQNLINRISYKFSSTVISTFVDISLQSQDRLICLILLILYVSKHNLEGLESYHLLAETQHFSIILMILLLLISSNNGTLSSNPNVADIALHLLATTMPYWTVNTIVNMYCTSTIKNNISLAINFLLILIIISLPLYLLCRKNFLVIQLINNNISTNNSRPSGGGKLLIFGAWLHVQLRWTVQQFLAIYWMMNVEAMLCPDKMTSLTDHLPGTPSYRTHLSILILSIGFFVSKIYNYIATNIFKHFDQKKIIMKSNIKQT